MASQNPPVPLLKVCIIGAGAAGLVNGRILSRYADRFKVTIYEKAASLGGTWVYSEETGYDSEGRRIHSSMYRGLRTNLPLCIMQYSDLDCLPNKQGFVSRDDVLSYLQEYAQHYDLQRLIMYNSEVVQVVRRADDWLVTVKTEDCTTSSSFDSVVVCNGRYSKPSMPQVHTLEAFTGQVLHSHDYRHADAFVNKRVLVVGAGPSGTDISLEVAAVACRVFLCHHQQQLFAGLPDNMEQICSSISSFDGRSISFKNGTILENMDVVLFATGYLFDLPFLHESGRIRVTEDCNRLPDVYLHFINMHHPSMAVFGALTRYLPFPIYEQQARLFAKLLLGEVSLPNPTQMQLDTEQDFYQRLKVGIPAKHAHQMTTSAMLWQYEERIARLGNLTRIPAADQSLFSALPVIRQHHLKDYKDWDASVLRGHEARCADCMSSNETANEKL